MEIASIPARRSSRAIGVGWALVASFLLLSLFILRSSGLLHSYLLLRCSSPFFLQLSAMDVSARTTMKGAAKCDKHCDLQNSVNQQGFERILRFRDIPESMPASESTLVSCCRRAPQPRAVGLNVSVGRVCAPRCFKPLMHADHLPVVGAQPTERDLRRLLPLRALGRSDLALALRLGHFLDMKLGQQTR